MPTPYEKLSALLKELFQLDQADLDFGIYRIMNQRRVEITRFLDTDLLPQVKAAFDQYHPADKKAIEAQIQKAIQESESLGVDPNLVPKVKELREQLATYSVDTGALENEVYSHLYNFFRRYYDNGDFISMRRYKEGVYAIPYEGEEVKLHWANADQYYIKTTENFRDYSFRLPSGRLAHFKIVDAETEKDNVKAADEKERCFILATENAVEVEEGALVMRFEYRADPEKRDQKALNALAAEAIQGAAPVEWAADLKILAPTESNPRRTLLEKHLADYSARNTFDYFIHKDLSGFLNRELDFYIKNEVMHLDDIEDETAERVEQYLSKIKAMRMIAHKIIDFLAQIEDFQKKLWLKKKFVIETNYCITLDRVPDELYPEICANNAQREEWARLFAIDEIKGDLIKPGYRIPLTVEFLKSNPFLVLDTKFFDSTFLNRLLFNLENINEQLDGLLIHSESFQALSLISDSMKRKVKLIYIDPPYNTGSDEFVYKDTFQDSSWISMMRDRLSLARELLTEEGLIFCSIDDNELHHSLLVFNDVFGKENHVATIVVKMSRATGVKMAHENVKPVRYKEYGLLYSKNKQRTSINPQYIETEEIDERYNKFITNVDELPENWIVTSISDALKKSGISTPEEKLKFYYLNSRRIIQLVTNDQEVFKKTKDIEKFQMIITSTGLERYAYDGSKVVFYSEKLKKIGGQEIFGINAGDLWIDVVDHVNDLMNEGGVSLTNGKKPEFLLQRVIELCTNSGDLVLDYCLGSGSSCAVATKLHRKWVGIELMDYFYDLPLTRIKKVLFGEVRGITQSINWHGGGLIKYIELESYEDTLNNLTLQRTEEQQLVLEAAPEFKENYMLSYMLDVESKGSLLNIQSFVHPFDYLLNIATGTVGESKPTRVDLVETFNYLIGLQVDTQQVIRGFHVATGKTLAGERTLIIWRDLEEKSNADLEEFFRKQDYNPRDMEYDLIYINGDNNLENLRRPDETWKVRLIEEEFLRLMFDEENN
jgi:adenine-specific DNA-methyltransferase